MVPRGPPLMPAMIVGSSCPTPTSTTAVATAAAAAATTTTTPATTMYNHPQYCDTTTKPQVISTQVISTYYVRTVRTYCTYCTTTPTTDSVRTDFRCCLSWARFFVALELNSVTRPSPPRPPSKYITKIPLPSVVALV